MTAEKLTGQQLAQLRAEVAAAEQAMREVKRDVLLLHKRAGQPLVIWKDGRVVLVPPDQILIDNVPSDSAAPGSA